MNHAPIARLQTCNLNIAWLTELLGYKLFANEIITSEIKFREISLPVGHNSKWSSLETKCKKYRADIEQQWCIDCKCHLEESTTGF